METGRPTVTDSACGFYLEALERFEQAGIPFLVGGALRVTRATRKSSGTPRTSTSSCGPPMRPRPRAVRARRLSNRADVPALVGQGLAGAHFIDVIFSSGNGVARVDDLWFEHAVAADVLGRRCGSARRKR